MITIFKTDAYKLHHKEQYPKGTEYVYSNIAVRNFNYFDKLFEGVEINGEFEVSHISYGAKYILTKLIEEWNKNFFWVKWEQIEEEITLFSRQTDFDIFKNIGDYKKLWELQELPLKFYFMPNGYSLIKNTPLIEIINTDKEFFWVVNYIETWLSSEYWSLLTAFNISYNLRTMSELWNKKSGMPENSITSYQFHDFSYRGMSSTESAIKTGIGHLANFNGTDNIPASVEYLKYKEMLEKGSFYSQNELRVPKSVVATEHSVMCAGGKENELQTYKKLIKQYPNGVLSLVSDTWNLWNVLDIILLKLKDDIMERNGKLVIRGDSGNPVDIICGNDNAKTEEERLGMVGLLAKNFGTEEVERPHYKNNLKRLNSKVGMIYGDGITPKIANEIFKKLYSKGYTTDNVILGAGSFIYQFITRDEMSIAMKATACKINGEWVNIQKSPITDVGKVSLKGFINVYFEPNLFSKDYGLNIMDNRTFEEWNSGKGSKKEIMKEFIFSKGEKRNGKCEF